MDIFLSIDTGERATESEIQVEEFVTWRKRATSLPRLVSVDGGRKPPKKEIRRMGIDDVALD